MTEPQSPDVEGGDAPNPESLVGSVLAGRYRLERLLGWGAMGAVYVGEHLKIGRRDAIKVLRASLARDREAVARFARGARNASAIRHPNVCTVYDFSDTSDGLQFLAMELVDGQSLTSLLQHEGPLSIDRAARIAIQTASGLQAAHDLGIVHRDMKPDNVMITHDRDGQDVAKVVDFDIAKGSAEGEERGVTRMGFVVGTPEYMSPEQLTGDPLDGRSDVYSLGIVLFRMLSGDLPYRAKSTQELMVDRLTRDPLRLADVAPDRTFPPAVQAVLDRALARDREGRPESAVAFARELWEAVYGPAEAAGTAGTASETSGRREATPGPADQVPATVVAPRGDPTAGSTAGSTPVSGPSQPGVRKRPLAWGAGAAALVVIAVLAMKLLGSPEAPVPAEVRVPASLSIGVGEDRRVDATVRADDGAVVAGAPLTWMSERPDVATVDGRGVVHGVSAGTSDVHAASGTLDASVAVTVGGADNASATALALGRRSLAFAVTQGGGSPRGESVEVTGAAPDGGSLVSSVAYASGGRSGWLSADLEGTLPPTRVRIGVRQPPSEAGTYRASVIVGWGDVGPADTMRVTLDVTTRPLPSRPWRTAAEADSLVWRQLVLVDDPPARRAVQDSTAMVWDDTSLPDGVRARAAYAHAQASVYLEDRVDALRWAERAVELAPGDENYRSYLQLLRGGSTP